jgi:opacity protein-like surface antigen
MKKFLIAATALSGLLALIGSASAADVAAAPGYDWTGPYIGIQGGYGWGEVGGSTAISDTHNIDDFPGILDSANGYLIGGTLGYNHQMDAIVIGLEADVSYSTLNDDFVTGDPEWHADLDWLATVRPRIGFAMDNFLPFITGGLAIGDMTLTSFDNVVPATPQGKDSNTMIGWTIGAGLEVAVTENLSVKAEYNYVDFGKEKFDLRDNTFFGVENRDMDIHLVKFGVNWQF